MERASSRLATLAQCDEEHKAYRTQQDEQSRAHIPHDLLCQGPHTDTVLGVRLGVCLGKLGSDVVHLRLRLGLTYAGLQPSHRAQPRMSLARARHHVVPLSE